MRQKAIVVDIDGCLIDTDRLYETIGSRDFSDYRVWDKFHKYANDLSIVSKVESVFNLVNAYNGIGYKIIVLTSRRDFLSSGTLELLLEGTIKLDNMAMLVMRSLSQEGIPSHTYKETEIIKLAKLYDIQLCIDDEDNNINMFKSLGYNTLKIGAEERK